MAMLKMKIMLTSLFCFCLLGNTFAQKNAHKWADFEHYSHENRLLKERNISEKKVVFMGNSITERWMKEHPDFFIDNGYVCRGVGGQTSYQFLLRFREDVVNLSPLVVVINAGTNDIAENTGPYNEDYTLGNIISMVEIAQANKIKVILTATLPAIKFAWNPEVNEVALKIRRFNRRLKHYAEFHHIPFVDYYSQMVEKIDNGMKAGYADDGVHPTLIGYKVMESMIHPIIDITLRGGVK